MMTKKRSGHCTPRSKHPNKKYTALESALEDIRTIVTPNTVVLSLLNGIDSEEKIAGVIDPGQIVYSLMRVSSERRDREDGRNVVSFDPSIPWGIYLGEKGSPVKSERIEAIEELFAGTSVGVFFVEDIIKDQWAKYASNICYNLPQAVLGLPFKAYFDSEHVAFLRQKLFDEVYKVGEALGIEVVEPILGWNSCAGSARFSTLQDLDAGRHTEIDMFTRKRTTENFKISSWTDRARAYINTDDKQTGAIRQAGNRSLRMSFDAFTGGQCSIMEGAGWKVTVRTIKLTKGE